jgi:hypothetical protein
MRDVFMVICSYPPKVFRFWDKKNVRLVQQAMRLEGATLVCCAVAALRRLGLVYADVPCRLTHLLGCACRARAVASLLDQLRARPTSPVDRIIKELCGFASADPSLTPVIANTIPAPLGMPPNGSIWLSCCNA